MKHQIVIAGAGLSDLTAACRLVSNGFKDIAVYAPAYGGTPYIAAIDFVLPNNKDNPYPDSEKCYEEDMIHAGYGINNKDLVKAMVSKSEETYAFLDKLGIPFSRLEDGSLRRRHLSGSTYPRSLCSTKGLIGVDMVKVLTEYLKKNGVEMNFGYKAYAMQTRGNKVTGMAFLNKDGKTEIVNASVFIAGWGGVGNLFGTSTYPSDESGRPLAIAYNAGVELVDLEFLEYEPMVVMSPKGAVGEPCPTAMLGEGAHLLNTKNERFLLKVRPEGEAGAPKTLINKAIWEQVKEGLGTEHGGCYADLRHIPAETLKLYPWFYNRLMENGVDPNKELVEVGPMAHSFSGGIKVDVNCKSNFENLYAVGEAAGGFHGACRMAGNAASQAAVSGLLAADAISKSALVSVEPEECELPPLKEDAAVCAKLTPQIENAAKALGVYRNGDSLKEAEQTITAVLSDKEIEKDTDTMLRAQSVELMIRAALKRTETRGTHNRTDFPKDDESQAISYSVCKK